MGYLDSKKKSKKSKQKDMEHVPMSPMDGHQAVNPAAANAANMSKSMMNRRKGER